MKSKHIELPLSRPSRHGRVLEPPPACPSPLAGHGRLMLVALVILTSSFLWAYWPTWVALVDAWQRLPDYSHGFLVPPLAAYFLWARRHACPTHAAAPAVGGLLVLALAAGVRLVGAMFFLQALDGWSMVLWLIGAVWLLFGIRVAWWSLPSLAFLGFMIPLPYRVEQLMNLPLQRLAAWAGGGMLQMLGQPAFAEGNTILLGEHQLEVEQACSGLRIFVGILALACVYVLLTRRAWWEQLLLLASAIPVALLANCLRIVATGLLYQYASTESAKQFSHDLAGWLMIPTAALLFCGVSWFVRHLTREQGAVDLATLLRQDPI